MHFHQPLPQRHETAQKVAAVHRYIPRVQRPQRAGIVPVEQVSPPFFQPFHRAERFLHPTQHFFLIDQAEIGRSTDAQQIQADIRRRSAVRDTPDRGFLQIIRREKMFLRRAIFRVITPCGSR